MSEGNRGVLVFRKRLVSYSETFIAAQGRYLPHYQAVFCGYTRDSSGFELLRGEQTNLLADYVDHVSLAKLSVRLGFKPPGRWIAALKSYQPDLIHAHFLKDGMDAVQLGRHCDLPVLTTLHGHDITKRNRGLDGYFKSRFFNRVDRVIAVSDYIREQALAAGCPEQKLVQHYIGIDLEQFTRPKLEAEIPSLLFVGRLVEKKGGTYLLQAMRKLQPKYPDLQLTLVGTGVLEQSLKKEAESYQLKVNFVGRKSPGEIKELLASHWIFVAPSIVSASGDAEGLGMVFLEAQALHTPVVSFNSGGVVEAVANEESGLLCEEKDVDALAQNIGILLEDESLRRKMGGAGRQRVERCFDIRNQCARLESIYDAVIQGSD